MRRLAALLFFTFALVVFPVAVAHVAVAEPQALVSMAAGPTMSGGVCADCDGCPRDCADGACVCAACGPHALAPGTPHNAIASPRGVVARLAPPTPDGHDGLTIPPLLGPPRLSV